MTPSRTDELKEAAPESAAQGVLRPPRPPRGLSQRITLALTVLLTSLAAIYSIATMSVIEFTEEELISGFLEDDMGLVVWQLENNEPLRRPPGTEIYGDAPGLPSIPAFLQDCPLGFTEIVEAPAVFVWRERWKGGSLMIVRDQEGFEEKEKMLLNVMLAILGLVFLLGAAAGRWLSRRVMQPVERLADAVREISAAPAWKPIPEELITRDEVGDLAAECSRAMKRLAEALRREKAFTGDVSHELRTPLTVIRTSAELLAMTDLTQAQRRQIERIERSALDMHELLEGFLAFARLSEKSGSDVPDTARGILLALEKIWVPQAASQGKRMEFFYDAECPGAFSPLFLSSVLTNLMRNALAYSKGEVVEVHETASGVRIRDYGTPIPKEERRRIFEAFERGESGSGKQGFGLGLSIVRRICLRMGWRAELEDLPDGNAFLIRLTGKTSAQARADSIS